MIEARSAESPLLTGSRDETVSLDALYRAEGRRLYSLLCRMVGDPADAEELLQEVFLQAHRRLGSFRHEAALRTWLHRIAVNRCLDYLRGRRARQDAMTSSLSAGATPAPSSRPVDTITRLDLERAIASLPDGCRVAFVLHDVEGFRHAEVAELLGVAVGTSKSQVHKARLRLRRLIGRPVRPPRQT